MWGWLTGTGAQKKSTAPKAAILGLRSQLDMLQKREQHLQKQMNEQDELARKLVTTDRNAAKVALRRKKQHEHTLQQTGDQITTIEQQISAIESANINRETLEVMTKANKAMKEIYNGLTPEEVDKIMDSIREQNAIGEEIVHTISSNNLNDAVDDMELEDELEQLQHERLDNDLLDSGKVPIADVVHSMPVAGKTPLQQTPAKAQEEDDEEEELRKLQAEMAM